jgi:hypothetical protein
MCNKLGIKIKASVACGTINENGQITEFGYPNQPFSNESFVDALVEFVVGDDVVSVSCHLMIVLICTGSYSL